MKVLLIRHGQKQPIPGDPGLTTLGQQQAETVSNWLAQHQQVSAVFASPLRRTQETAAIIAKATGREVVTDARLQERANWQPQMELRAFIDQWEQASVDRDLVMTGGVSSRQAGSNIQALLSEIEPTYQKSTIVLVTHGGIITDYLRNIASDAVLLERHYRTPESLYYTEIAECSVTAVEMISESETTIEYISRVVKG